MAKPNPFLSAFEKSLAASQSLQEARDLVASGTKQAVDPKTGLITPRKLEESHVLARQGSKGSPGLMDEFLVEHGGRTWNIAPNAAPVVMMPTGKVVTWPKDRMHQIPSNAQVLNKSEKDIDRLIPRPKAGSEMSTQTRDISKDVLSPSVGIPTSILAGGALGYGLTGQNPLAVYGTSAQQPSFANTPLSPDYIASAANAPDQAAAPAAASPVVQKAEDVVAPATGGSSPRQLSNEQILDLARKSINPEPPAADYGDDYGYTGQMGAYLQGSLDAARSAPRPAAAAPAPAPARARMDQTNIPAMPVRRPGSPTQDLTSEGKPVDQGFFSRIFGQDPYAGKSASQLMTAANRDPDNAAAFFRADEALRKERPEMFKQQTPDEGMKRGGTAQVHGKDAALHKALEIIHHMISRGR